MIVDDRPSFMEFDCLGDAYKLGRYPWERRIYRRHTRLRNDAAWMSCCFYCNQYSQELCAMVTSCCLTRNTCQLTWCNWNCLALDELARRALKAKWQQSKAQSNVAVVVIRVRMTILICNLNSLLFLPAKRKKIINEGSMNEILGFDQITAVLGCSFACDIHIGPTVLSLIVSPPPSLPAHEFFLHASSTYCFSA